MSHDDFRDEPIPGLPGELPSGERLLWQGTPVWTRLARTAFFTRTALFYGGGLIALQGLFALYGGKSLAATLSTLFWPVVLVSTGIGLLALLAFLSARTTVYTITNKRVVMRIGIALTLDINVPFKRLAGAGVKLYRDGSGDIPLHLAGDDRFAYVHLMPHARPWHFKRPQPMLRAVPDAARVGALLAEAVERSGSGLLASGVVPDSEKAPVPQAPTPANAPAAAGHGLAPSAG